MTPLPSIADLDAQLTTPQFLIDPYSVYRRLRQRQPVHWSEAWQSWLLTRYQDVAQAMRDFKRFSNVGIQQRFLDQLPRRAMPRIRPLYQHFSTGLTRTDPPRHTRIRALTAKAFSPSVIESMRPRIRQVVDQLIDAIQGNGRIELIRDFAYPLPGTVLADLFGFPHQDREQFQAWSKQIIAFHGTGRADQATVEHSQEALLEARGWLGKLIEERRRRPRQDLLTLLVEAEEAGDRPDRGRIVLELCHLHDWGARDHHQLDRQWDAGPAPQPGAVGPAAPASRRNRRSGGGTAAL